MSSPQVWTQVRTWGRAPDLVCVPESPLNTHGEGGEQGTAAFDGWWGEGSRALLRAVWRHGRSSAVPRALCRAGLAHAPPSRNQGWGGEGTSCLEGLCWWGQ